MIYLVKVWPNAKTANNAFTHGAVEKLLNSEHDWIRFDDLNWLVQSHRDARQLSKRIQGVVSKSIGSFLVIEVERENVEGLMVEAFWTWLNAPERHE